MTLREKVLATMKSTDTEGPFELYVTRTPGYLWACLFRLLGVHPIAVTLMSIVIGTAAGIFFYFDDLKMNIIGMLLLVWANWYDCADGQLARMTGKKTLIGRVLDGFAGDVWFFCIYAAICLRLQDDCIPFTEISWGIWIWLLCAFAGFVCHGKQCQLADYYRNIHLYFIKGEAGSELDNSRKLSEEFASLNWKHDGAWKLFLFFYRNYTRNQESMTHDFQSFKQKIDQRFGRVLPATLIDEFRTGSLPLLPYANILTFNTRAIVLYVSLQVGHPWIYPVFEITLMNILFFYMHSRHEALCRRLEEKYFA